MSDQSIDEWPPYDPDRSPFDAPEVEGIPFGKDSDEARAIERILRRAEWEADVKVESAAAERRPSAD